MLTKWLQRGSQADLPKAEILQLSCLYKGGPPPNAYQPYVCWRCHLCWRQYPGKTFSRWPQWPSKFVVHFGWRWQTMQKKGAPFSAAPQICFSTGKGTPSDLLFPFLLWTGEHAFQSGAWHGSWFSYLPHRQFFINKNVDTGEKATSDWRPMIIACGPQPINSRAAGDRRMSISRHWQLQYSSSLWIQMQGRLGNVCLFFLLQSVISNQPLRIA